MSVSPRWRELLSLMSLFSICHTSLVLQPILLGAFVDYRDLSEKLAGFVAAAEMGGFCLAVLATLPWIAVVDRRRLAWKGIAIYIIANILTMFSNSAHEFMLIRSFVGIGGGLCFATFNAVLARSTEPDRTLASVMIVAGIHTALLLWLFPYLAIAGGVGALMMGQIVNAVIFALLVIWLPRHAPRQTTVMSEQSYSVGLAIVFILGALLLVHTGHTAIWAYIERMGNALKIDGNVIGLILGSASLLATLGSALASWSGCRFGRSLPNLIAITLLSISVLSLVYADSAFLYIISLVVFKVSWFFGVPFLVGLCALYDKKGRGTVLAGFMAMAGSSLGPALGALTVDNFGYAGLGWLSTCCYLLCFLLSVKLLFMSDKQLSLLPELRLTRWK